MKGDKLDAALPPKRKRKVDAPAYEVNPSRTTVIQTIIQLKLTIVLTTGINHNSDQIWLTRVIDRNSDQKG